MAAQLEKYIKNWSTSLAPKEVLGFLRRPNEWWTLVVAYGLRKHNASLAQLSINALIVWWKRSQ